MIGSCSLCSSVSDETGSCAPPSSETTELYAGMANDAELGSLAILVPVVLCGGGEPESRTPSMIDVRS